MIVLQLAAILHDTVDTFCCYRSSRDIRTGDGSHCELMDGTVYEARSLS